MLAVGMLIKRAMQGHIDLLGPAKAVGEALIDIPSFDVPDFSQPLSEEKYIVARLKKVFLMIAGSAVQKFGLDLEEHQMLLLSVADILIQIYIAESAVLRTEKNVERFGKADQAIQIAITQLYVYRAVEIITQKGKEAIISFAEGDEQRMLLMGLKRFTKYINLPNVTILRTQIADDVAKKNGYTFDASK